MIDQGIPDTRIAVYNGEPKAVVAVDVAPEGLTLIRSEMLDHGPLSQRVAELFGDGGVAFAPMFEGTSADDAKRFTYDAVGKSVAHKWIAEYANLQCGEAGCQIIIEEPWQNMTHVSGRDPGCRYFGRGICPYFTSETGDLFKDIEEAASETTFKRFGFIISPPVTLPSNGAEADAQTIEALARNTKMAFMSAYDDMGYVVWMK